MQSHIEKNVFKIISDPTLQMDYIELIKALMHFKHGVDTMVEKVFINDSRFQAAKDASFRLFIRSCFSLPFQMASYCDFMIRNLFTGLNDEEISVTVEEIMSLISILNDQDSFFQAYFKHLADRLIRKAFNSKKTEILMLDKLK
jgi:hypothetical protein